MNNTFNFFYLNFPVTISDFPYSYHGKGIHNNDIIAITIEFVKKKHILLVKIHPSFCLFKKYLGLSQYQMVPTRLS